MKLSASASIEAKILKVLRGLGLGMPCVGLMEIADDGVQKEQDPTSVQVRVFNFAQSISAREMFTVAVEIRLNVEQSESANGGGFFAAHERIAGWLEHVMLGCNCDELDTSEVYVDGLMRTGDEKDFDTAGREWFAVWNMTLSGRIKEN